MIKTYILAGGLGTRLRSVARDLPKPLVLVAGRPFITYPINWLQSFGVADITICVGYKAEAFYQILGNGQQLGIRLSYAIEDEPLGTGGATKLALDSSDSTSLVMNGDTYIKFDLETLLSVHKASGAWVTLVLKKMQSGHARGCVELMSDGHIRRFVEKPSVASENVLINAGVYIFDRTADFGIFPDSKFSLEKDYFPVLANAGHLGGYITDGYFADIGTPETLQRFSLDVLKEKINDNS